MSGLSHVHRQALSPPHPDRRPAKVTSERMSRAGACDNRSMLDKSDAKDKNAGRHTPSRGGSMRNHSSTFAAASGDG